MIVLIDGHEVLIDDEDAYRLTERWRVETRREQTGRVYHYVVKSAWQDGKDVVRRLHREIMSVPAGLFVDHRNGNTLDNRRENLRVCTPSQNSRNKVKSATSAAPYKGIKKRNQKWEARIYVDGKSQYLGVFDTPELAAAAYEAKAKEYFGDFDVSAR